MSLRKTLALCLPFASLLLLVWSLPAGAAPAPTPTPIPTLVTNGSRAVSEVALTFDGCPSPWFDAAIVHVLTETQTPATFFLSGQWVRDHVTATRALAATPYFELGDHSWSHADFSRISPARMVDEITRTEQLLTQITGRRGTLFRFPYGRYTSRAIQQVYQLGLLPIQWDVVSADPAPAMTARLMTTRVLSRTQDGSIVIMHVNGRGWHTAEALPGIIAGLHARGFRFVTVSQLLSDSTVLRRPDHRD